MSIDETDTSEHERLLDDVLTAYLQAVDAGHSPDRSEWLLRYPNLASELHEFFADQDKVASWTEPIRAATECPSTQVSATDSLPYSSPIGQEDTLDTHLGSFGDYELLEVIGRGGMGIVYKARQKSLNRLVALKMIRTGLIADKVEAERFRREAETIALLDHPNIVPIYSISQAVDPDSPVPYFTTKLIEGGSLAQAIASNKLSVLDKEGQRQIAQLMVTIAKAVHHAHQRGILHRDLKPSNVLLQGPLTYDVSPVVTDFGLAKRLEDDRTFTDVGAIVGTPNYLAPEQAWGKKGSTTTATDVYGLGTIFYALLTGKPVFQGETPLDVLERVKNREPERPSRITPQLDRDLETICLKCLQKEPYQRYNSAEAVAEDLNRWLKGEPIRARPVGRREHIWRWFRRNPVVASLATGFLFLLVLVLIGLPVSTVLILGQRNQARTNLARAENREASLRRHVYVADVHQAQQEWENGSPERMREILRPYIPREGEEDLRTFAWYYLWRLGHSPSPVRTLSGQGKEIFSVAFSPDGKELATAGQDGTVRLTDAETGSQQHCLRVTPPCEINCVAFSPDGKTLATANDYGKVLLWDLTTGNQIAKLNAHVGDALAVAFSPDGRSLATGGDDRVIRFWDVQTQKMLFDLSIARQRPAEPADSSLPWGRIGTLAFSPDGKRLVSSHFLKYTVIWDIATRKIHGIFDFGKSCCAAVSHGGQLVAFAGEDDAIYIADMVSGRLTEGWRSAPTGGIRSLSFSRNDSILAAAGADGIIRFWDVATRKVRNSIQAHQDRVDCVVYAPGASNLIATASRDGMARVWNDPDPKSDSTGGIPVAISPDGRNVVLRIGTNQETLRFLDPLASKSEDRIVLGPGEKVAIATFSGDDHYLAAAIGDQLAQVWDIRTGQAIKSSFLHERIGPVALSPDGKWLATGGFGKTVYIWEVSTGHKHFILPTDEPVTALAFSADGDFLASGGDFATLRVWAWASGEIRVNRQKTGRAHIWRLAYSPNGKFLAVGGMDGYVELMDSATGEQKIYLQAHPGGVSDLAFTPDGTTLASGGANTIRLWDVATGKELITISLQWLHSCHYLRFTSDGLTLVSADMISGDTMVATILSADCTGIPMQTP